MKATIMLFVVVFITIASLAFGDIGVLVRADLSKIRMFEGKSWSEEVPFKEGKAIWSEYGDFHFAFYDDEALGKLIESDSTKVVLVPGKGKITPPFGNLYIVIRNLLWGVGMRYGLDSETYYVWSVKFITPGIRLKDENGIFHKGVAPFGDNAINTIPEKKFNNPEMAKKFSASTESENKK